MSLTNKTAKLFASYIQTRKIVIADTSSASRAGLAKTLVSMGAKTQNIAMAANYELALDAISKASPSVVICDYDLGSECGLNLLQKQRAENPNTKESLFVLVTGNTSQSAVAQAAEEDVDTFILKPYTIEQLRNSLIKATLAKIYPSDYVKKIAEGKVLLEEGKIDDSLKVFEEAKSLDPKPSLACFYHGQAQLIKEIMEGAEEDFSSGLKHNKIHYKCMTGLFDLYQDQNKHKDAYEVSKRISRYFPANPKRLTQVLRLAVVTQSYEDIERYYQAFTSIDTRNDELIRYVCAALVVCGKFYLQRNFNSRAIELFQKAGTAAAGRVKILKEIVFSLVEFDMIKEAEEFLKKFPETPEAINEKKAMEYFVASKVLAPAILIQKGRDLLKDFQDPVVYEVLISKSYEAGYEDNAENLIHEAVKAFPDNKAKFEKLKPAS